MRHAPRDIDVHVDMVAAVDETVRILESLGHTVEAAHPKALDEPDIVRLYVDVVCANVARALESWGEKLGEPIDERGCEPLTWALAQRGRELSATRLLEAIEAVHGFGRRVAAFFAADGGQGGYDLLLTPTQAQPPPELGYMAQMPDNPLGPFLRAAPFGVFTLPFNLSGQPAISVPGHFTTGDEATPQGLPIGVQLVAASGDEATLLDVAAQLERATLFTAHRPPIFG
jgi:amidase